LMNGTEEIFWSIIIIIKIIYKLYIKLKNNSFIINELGFNG
jgi:hypothetical protein